MSFRPIISTLRRHKLASSLIVLEIALTCAIVCNAVFVIGDRLSRMDRSSGLVEDELVRVQITGIGKAADANALTAQDLRALAALPGVTHVAATNMVPFGNSSWNTDMSTVPDDPKPPINAAVYMGSPGLIATMGLHLVAGRDFLPEEYLEYDAAQAPTAHVPSIIITRAAGEKLFGTENPLGKRVYVTGKEPQIVVGILDELARPNENQGGLGQSMILPINLPFTVGGSYLIRTTHKAEVLAAVDAVITRVDPNRIILSHEPFSEIRRDHFKQDRAMAYLLAGVSFALLVITALGVIGLAGFWVQQRTRQIGVRRALGASRGDIVRYFQLENFILATIGIVIGMGLAYAINLWLMSKYEVARLPAEILPIGAGVLWALGQIAVLSPALRASKIPPAIATRA